MLNPNTQLFQSLQPYVLEGQQLNLPTLINLNYPFLNPQMYLPFYHSYQNFPLQDLLKVETSIKMEQEPPLNVAQLKDTSIKIEGCESFSQFLVANEESKFTNLRQLIIEMLQFFIQKFGQANKDEIAHERKQYNYSSSLLELFDNLAIKYTSAKKCREDKVRFILRKAMTFLRDSFRYRYNISAKAASKILCMRYFVIGFDEEAMKRIHLKTDTEFLSLLLPYKRNSRNQTANSRFIKEIFGSEAFYQDYIIYLRYLNGILEYENQIKIDKFATFLEKCVQEKSLYKIKQFKRLPWLKVWLVETENIAYEFLNMKKSSQERSTITDPNKLKTFK